MSFSFHALQAGLYDAARIAYGEALELLEGGVLLPMLYNNRAAACLMLRRYEEALSDSLKAVELDSSSVRGLARAAKACMCMGRMEQASELYGQVTLRVNLFAV